MEVILVAENSEAKKMERALSGDFAEQWETKKRKDAHIILSNSEKFNNLPENEKEIVGKIFEDKWADRALLLMTNPSLIEAETAMEEQMIMDPTLVNDPLFLWQLNRIRDIQTASGLQQKNDSVSMMATLYKEQPQQVKSYKEMAPYYFSNFIGRSPNNSGQLEEIIGPMGSGKTNFLAWKALWLLESEYVVITNFSLRNLPEKYRDKWIEVHSYIDLFGETVKLKLNNYDKLIFWLIDEQGIMPGGTSQTVSMREGRWQSELLKLIRKFGVFLTRARQSNNIPQEQLSWISFIIEKSVKEPDVVKFTRFESGEVIETYSFTIPSMRNYYDTNDPALISMDLNMEMLLKYASRKMQKAKSEQDKTEIAIKAVGDFIEIARKLDDVAWKKFEENIDELESGIDEAVKEDRRGTHVNSIKNLKQYRDKTNKTNNQSEKK